MPFDSKRPEEQNKPVYTPQPDIKKPKIQTGQTGFAPAAGEKQAAAAPQQRPAMPPGHGTSPRQGSAAARPADVPAAANTAATQRRIYMGHPVAPAQPGNPSQSTAHRPPAGVAGGMPVSKMPQPGAANKAVGTPQVQMGLPQAGGGPPRKKGIFVPLHMVGNLFYALGFYAECRVVQVWRVIREIFNFIGQILSWLFGGLLGKLGQFFTGIGRDVAAPFKRFAEGVRNMRALVKEEKKRGAQKVSHTMVTFFGRGVKSHGHLVGNLVSYLLPLVALAILSVVVYQIVSMQYALQVEVNGSLIGYVQDETVLEEAQNILRMKIRLSEDQSLEDWEFSPVVRLSATDTVYSNTQIADLILENSGNEIEEATGIYIDGELVGATTQGDTLRQYLEDKIAAYTNPSETDAVVTFARNVQVSPEQEVFLAESVQSFEDLENRLESTVSPAVHHTVTEGETLSGIAHSSGIPLADLLARNPQYSGEDSSFTPPAGEELLIRREQPFLQVQKAVREMRVEEIPFETVEEFTDSKVEGFRLATTEGENGERQVPWDLVYIDGELVEEKRLEEGIVVTKEPVNEVIEVGTGVVEGIGNGNVSGFFIFPVPTATYSSRGWLGDAHRGVDINAPEGTPMYAADGGVVITATYSGSYGNFIEIQHPNGMSTLYAHCVALNVSAGDVVGQGDMIAWVGNTGFSTGPHLHFEVWVDGVRVDPGPFLSFPFERGY